MLQEQVKDSITIRGNLHLHFKVQQMTQHLINNANYRLRYVKMMNNNVDALDSEYFYAATHRMLVGALVMVWGKAARDGYQSGVFPEDIILTDAGQEIVDAIAGFPGLFDALKAVDWLCEEKSDEGSQVLRFPRLMRYV